MPDLNDDDLDELLLYLTRVLVAVTLPDDERPERTWRTAA